MPDMDDFFAFTSTNDNNNSANSGCSLGCLTWLLAALAFIFIIGRLAG